MDHFMLQAATVRDAGRDVVKGARLTDDTWRALCLMRTWLLDEKFCDEHLKYNMSNAHRGGLGAVSSGYGTTAINGFGSQIVGGDPAVLLRVGATSGGIASGSLSSLYAIAAGGLRRDRQK